MMEAASTSETSVNLYQTTQHCNPEASHLYIFDQFHEHGMGILLDFDAQVGENIFKQTAENKSLH
jgi:hypothetical protein